MPTAADEPLIWSDNSYQSTEHDPCASPSMKPMTLKIEKPSHSPPPLVSHPLVCFPQSPDEPGYSNRQKVPQHPGDAFLIAHNDNHRNPDIAREANLDYLPGPDEYDSSAESNTIKGERRDTRSGPAHHNHSSHHDDERGRRRTAAVNIGQGSLESLAASALFAVAKPRAQLDCQFATEISASTGKLSIRDEKSPVGKPILQKISAFHRDLNGGMRSPSLNMLTPSSNTTGLPPISPGGSEHNGQTLPSIRSQLGDMKLPLGDRDSLAQRRPSSNFGQSPPGVHQLPPLARGHGSPQPPISPPDSYQRSLPSPRSITASSPFITNYPSVLPHRSSVDFGTKSPGESSITDQSTPIPPHLSPGMDRMSIDGITNPQVGNYVCNFTGCNAPPFQTQYLLNSHANVHSSARPHYCPVQGCSRSEGGKGFKRKNEMIRHGLVHDSPGYICPFCPDRDHRYPRPDNLQRYVNLCTPRSMKGHVC